jgi:threonine synthase
MKVSYSCISCGRTLDTDEVIYECPYCVQETSRLAASGFPRGCLSVPFVPAEAYRKGQEVDVFSFLPLRVTRWQSFPAGNTPLVLPERLRQGSGFRELWLKNDTLNMSGSLKDRASLLVAEQALSLGQKRVVLASTGNAGASTACVGAAYGLEVILFVPAAAPRAKLLQSLFYGARVVPVQGTYDVAFQLSIAFTRRFGGINRNTAFNPFTVEGKKTVSLEIYNQLGSSAPDVLYVPTGDGVIFSGACKGFADLQAAGLIKKMPLMIAVQAQGSNAIALSWKNGHETVIASTSTIADSLSVCRPAAGAMALEFLRLSAGRAVEVTDSEISAAQVQLAREAGLFVEPSSAAALAGFMKDRTNLDPGARVVVLLTGTGFKDTSAVEKLVTMPEPCTADLDSAARLLHDRYSLHVE